MLVESSICQLKTNDLPRLPWEYDTFISLDTFQTLLILRLDNYQILIFTYFNIISHWYASQMMAVQL
jgi:hypothetical protein